MRKPRPTEREGGLALLAFGLALLVVALLSWALVLRSALGQARAEARDMALQLRVLSAAAQDARTPELLLHRFLVAWVVGSGAEVDLYLAPELQAAWRRSLALAGWRPGPRGLAIDHYRLDESQPLADGARYRVTFFAGPAESEPAYTMTLTVRGRPGAYAVTSLAIAGASEAPPKEPSEAAPGLPPGSG